MTLNTVFNQFAVLLALTVLLGVIATKLRQPLIVSFILVGIIAGQDVLGLISAHSEIKVLASFGITLLLFIVGLKLDLETIKTFGGTILLLGFGQIIFTTLAGWWVTWLCGIEWHAALFLALALTFSSTIIIIKVLSDRYEIDSLYGRLSIGILIIQDIVAVLAIIVLTSLSLETNSYTHLQWELIALLLKGLGFMAFLWILMHFVLPRVIDQFARSNELLILFALSWAVILAVVANSLGFSKEVGGFLAGVSLASSHYRESIAGRLETVRNLLLLFFFLDLGASLQINAVFSQWQQAFWLLLFVILVKPLLVILLTRAMRFRMRTGFLTAMTMGQISEFSLILVSLGLTLGYIDQAMQSLMTLIGLVSIGLSAYIIAYSHTIYQFLAPTLSRLEQKIHCREEDFIFNQNTAPDIIIYGFGRHGQHMAHILANHDLHVLCIDFDPRKSKPISHDKIMVQFGDAEDPEFSNKLPLSNVKLVISTIPAHYTNQALVKGLREAHFEGKIVLSAYHESQKDNAKKLGVDLILVPYKDAALAAAKKILKLIHQ